MRVAKNGPVIACALSGGIDSLISAKILKEKVYMKNWDLNEDLGYCTGERDLRDAENVCKILDIPFHIANFVQDYWHNVFQPVLNDFKDGYYTPNPDILCNSQIKFGSFLQYCVKELQVVAIATGHYAGNSWPTQKVLANSQKTPHYDDDVNYVTTLSYSDQPKLLEAAGDSVKDQSFFLSNINTLALSKSIFPLSIHTKDAVKSAICHDSTLAPIWARRPESQGICFVGKREKFDRFLAQYLGQSVGSNQKNKTLPRILDIENKGHLIGHLKDHVIDVPSFKCETAERKNILSTPFVTIGQRIPHSRIQFETSINNNNRPNKPFYVVYKCKYSSDIYVSKSWNHPLLYSTLFITEPAHWINNDCTTIFQNDNINSFSNQNATIANKNLFLRQNNRKMFPLYFRHVNIEAKYPCNFYTISNLNQMEFISVLQRAILQNGPQNAKFEHFYHVISDEFEKNFCTIPPAVNLNDNFCNKNIFKHGSLIVQTKYPSRAITPGQYAVFYDGNVCLGCARIKFVIPNFEEID